MDILFSLILFLTYVRKQLPSNPPAPIIQQATPPLVTERAPVTSALTREQKRRAEQLTSIFENGTPQFNYHAIEDLGDGRGYTAGRAGFTTATGDAYLVAERYTRQVQTNPLAPYLSRLEQLAEEESEDTSALEGFVEAWQEAATDVRFRNVQDSVIDELYYYPAMAVADQLGIASALGRAILYDTIIQHGGGNSEDSLSGIVSRTNSSLQGTPKTGIQESLWLDRFLDVRKENLLRPANQTTQAVWAVSIGRVEILRTLLIEKNMDLHGPIIVDTEEYQAKIL